jgi:hypothetical protein
MRKTLTVLATAVAAALAACGNESTAPTESPAAARAKVQPDSIICGIAMASYWSNFIDYINFGITQDSLRWIDYTVYDILDFEEVRARHTYVRDEPIKLPRGAWKTDGDSVAYLHAAVPVIDSVWAGSFDRLRKVKKTHIILDLKMWHEGLIEGSPVHLVAGSIARVEGSIQSYAFSNGQLVFCKPE